MSNEIKVTFKQGGAACTGLEQSVFVLPGTILLEAAARAGFIIETPCGGSGKCGKCLVRVISGECTACAREKEVLDTEHIEQGYRPACQCKVTKHLTVEVPETSLFQTGQKVLLHDSGHTTGARPDISEDARHGLAFDIGTTTIVGTLVDLISGNDLAVTGMINPQISFGDDVLSRIKICMEDEDGLHRLNKIVLEAVNSTTDRLVQEAGVDKKTVSRAVFAGNTAMQEILCGINPRALGQIPFAPAFHDPMLMKAKDLGLKINPGADVYVFPQIGGFVGGDTVAGIIATCLDRLPEPALFVDVGTNGEIVLAHDGKLSAASVAAGPAFEGARIVNGMRAANGAIEKVVIDGNVLINVIGNTGPTGICGSGLIDAAAALLQTGVLDDTGRILGPGELPDNVPGPIMDRIVAEEGHFNFVLVDRAESAADGQLCLYQKDIRELQLAKGAIRAGIEILLKMEGMEPSDLGSVLLAGAFGNFIRRSSVMRIGMLPRIDAERIRFAGNTASFGAKRVLLSDTEREYAGRIRRETRHVDLSMDPDFQTEFSSAMLFPEH